ncbi:hypothetical protein A5482_013985 [Cyanobacterium sp. IPPAS B-1200]|uniref:hypothetical protein n=1 Tax=Cyanobacterium sp. IPPAS B-1200 TaxID=1562720 RepID=UPI00085257A1|nr:hypothetical protein [Cyanobacterium sp. IPPAS B-1200]OEJ78507.1 hypothetical protein A5482_12695 [Cyanobacterium sp. IPPAS B-1200]
MNNYSDEVEILIKLNSVYLEELTNISQNKQISLNSLLNALIDDFLANKNNCQNTPESNYNEQQINEIVQRAIAPLITRIEELENNHLNKQRKSKSKNSKTLQPSKIIPEEKRKYLPRHEVWQILKKTSFVQHSGYDNFLKATPQELESYDIFFDTDKKRFYIEEKNPDSN